MKIMSKRDKMVGMKSMLSSPFVSSHRPNTELAAASTEQREFKVVVIPAYIHTQNQQKSFRFRLQNKESNIVTSAVP